MAKTQRSNPTTAAVVSEPSPLDEAACTLFDAAADLVTHGEVWADLDAGALALRALARCYAERNGIGGFGVRVEMQTKEDKLYHPLDGMKRTLAPGPFLALRWDEEGCPARHSAPLSAEDAASTSADADAAYLVERAEAAREAVAEDLWEAMCKLAVVEALAASDPATFTAEWPVL